MMVFILSIAFLHLAATECSAELIVESSERLTFLVEGMDAALDGIQTIRADVSSIEVYEVGREPRRDIINKTQWLSKGNQYKFVNNLTQLYDGKLPPKPKPGQKHVPVGKRFTECAYSGGLFIEVRPRDRKAIIADWKNRPASTLQDRANHEPHFYGMTIKGLSLTDIVAKEKYWHRLPETIDPRAQRRVKWAGKKEYKGRKADVVELFVKWTGSNGSLYEHVYEVVVEPERGFSIPFISEAYREDGGPLQTIETVETECVDYGSNIWGPKKTVCTSFFTAKKGRGKSVTTITIEDMKFNSRITDEELMVTLEDGTRVDDLIANQYIIYTKVNGNMLLASMQDSYRKAGYTGMMPIRGRKARLRTSLVGENLPDFDSIKINIATNQTQDKRILICFFDMNQRSSRHCLRQLNKRAQELKAKDVSVIAVQIPKVAEEMIIEWAKDQNIYFSVGMVRVDEEEIRFSWGVKSLPWLILTNKQHIVIAEGFNLDELEDKIKTITEK